MEFEGETEYILCEKYKVMKRIIPNLSFEKYVKFQPTVQFLELCNDLLNTQLMKASSVRKIVRYVDKRF